MSKPQRIIIDLGLERCIHCRRVSPRDFTCEAGNGERVCDSCAYDFCTRCLLREPDFNDEMCIDCASGLADTLYEEMRERDWY